MELKKPPIEIYNEEKREITFLGMARKKKGLTVYKYNRTTGELSPVKYMKQETYAPGTESQLAIMIEKDCTYIQALNKKNAWKKIRKLSLTSQQKESEGIH